MPTRTDRTEPECDRGCGGRRRSLASEAGRDSRRLAVAIGLVVLVTGCGGTRFVTLRTVTAHAEAGSAHGTPTTPMV